MFGFAGIAAVGGGGAACGMARGAGAAGAAAAGILDPHDTQKRFVTGLRVEHVAQTGPSSRLSKLNAGASGLERPPKLASPW